MPLLIPQDKFLIGEFIKPNAPDHAVTATQVLPAYVYKEWIGHLQEEFLRDSATQSEARLKGDSIHFCLSQIGNLNQGNAKDVIEQAIQTTKQRYGAKVDKAELSSKILSLVQNPTWKDLFYLSSDVKVLCEQEVVNRFGDTRRLDRVIVGNKDVTVVDFKTSRLH